jgi:hypothetical protein
VKVFWELAEHPDKPAYRLRPRSELLPAGGWRTHAHRSGAVDLIRARVRLKSTTLYRSVGGAAIGALCHEPQVSLCNLHMLEVSDTHARCGWRIYSSTGGLARSRIARDAGGVTDAGKVTAFQSVFRGMILRRRSRRGRPASPPAVNEAAIGICCSLPAAPALPRV